MVKKEKSTPGQRKIARIGGRLSADYYHLQGVIEMLNDNVIPLFQLLGMDEPGDKEDVIDALIGNSSFLSLAKNIFIANMTKKVTEGKIKKEKILSKMTLGKSLSDPEAEKQRIERELHRKLCFKYNEVQSYYIKNYCYYSISSYSYCKPALKICRDALEYSSSGLSINEEKFIELYSSYIEADESDRRKQHQEAADGINRFFGGAVEITDKELERYFMIENGILKPNPLSVNIESYMRLGTSSGSKKKKK